MNETTNKNPLEAIAVSTPSAVDTPRTLEIIAGEIRTFTASMLNNIIEIGRRMCEAKEMLPYGKFGDWIEENTGYSRSTANNYMRVFQEYGTRQGCLFGATVENDQAFGKLTYTKALALLDVPAEEREAFVADHDVESMSTRELQAAIAERDEARKSAQEKDEALSKQKAETLKARFEIKDLQDKVKELEARPVEVVTDQEAVDKAVAEAVKKTNDAHAAELEKIKAAEEKKRKSLEKKVADAEKAAKAAEEKASEAGKGADEEAEALRETAKKLNAEVENLRRELALSGEAAVSFKTHFALWQQEYRNMTEALKRADEETAGKFRAAINAQMEGWKNG